MHTEFRIEALSWNLLSLVKIDDIPSLVGTVMFVVNDNSLSFLILSTSDIKSLSSLPIDEVFIFILEELPPFGVGAVDLHVSSFS
jgi:hypothetical protein